MTRFLLAAAQVLIVAAGWLSKGGAFGRRNLFPNSPLPGYGRKSRWALWLRPAYVVRVFLWNPLGIDHVRPVFVLVNALGMALGPPAAEVIWYGVGHGQRSIDFGHTPLACFALLYLVLGLAIWGKRVWGMHRGREIHSKEGGWTLLARYTPLPLWLTEAVLMPAAVGAAGYITQPHSAELGYFLEYSGAALFFVGCIEGSRRFGLRRTNVNNEVHSQIYSQAIDEHERRKDFGRYGSAQGEDRFARLNDDER